jgi:acetolactate synthase-1/2/3 large subunit
MRENFAPSTCFVTDSGNGTFLAMEHLRLKNPRRFLAPVDFSCMGYSVPAAIGAALARPEGPVIALVGDGAFNMTGLELLTAQRERLAAAFFILCDRELSQIAQFQRRVLHRTTLTELAPLNYQALASGLGVAYCHLQNDHQLKSVFEQVSSSLQVQRPILVEVNIDYSRETHFTQGAIKTNFQRLEIKDKLRLAGRLVSRKIFDRS